MITYYCIILFVCLFILLHSPRLTSGEIFVSLSVRHAVYVCVSAALVSAAKVTRCIQSSLVIIVKIQLIFSVVCCWQVLQCDVPVPV